MSGPGKGGRSKRNLSRRVFLARSGGTVAVAACACAPTVTWLLEPAEGTEGSWHSLSGSPDKAPVARFWVSANASKVDCLSCHTPLEEKVGEAHPHEQEYVRCLLCARKCLIEPGQRGLCRARVNDSGTLRSLVYGHPVSVHVDPIEKKPFYHFLPGSEAFSLATTGCPMRCKFCQNWEISQASPEDYSTEFTAPDRIVKAADSRGARVIAFTYNEPTVFTEYLLDTARLTRKRETVCVLVSCGYMNEDPLDEMCDLLSGIKIDLKGFSREFYEQVVGADIDPVLRSIKQVSRRGVHLEIVNLVVPTLNDSESMIRELCKWLMGEVGPDVPVHFTRFHPDYRLLNLPPTPVSTLERAYSIAREEGLHYPYVGNVPGHEGNNTKCPKCGRTVIARNGFFVTERNIRNGCCSFCGEKLTGIWTLADLRK